MKHKFTNPLDNIEVASPCSANWDEMVGNNRERHCAECKLNVYNLSGMTRKDAENLLVNAEGRVCVRYFKRKDGTVITKDCPVGWKAIKRRVSKTATAFASLIFAALGGIGITNFVSQAVSNNTIGGITLHEETMGTIPYEEEPTPVIEEETIAVMGDIAYPPEYETKGKVANFDEVKRQIIEEHGQ